jgi:hypothetical protein
MKNISKYLIGLAASALVLTACHKDLDRFPPNDVTSETLYKNKAGYTQVLAKVYGSMALTGNQGPAGSGDVAGIDEGTSDFLRMFWKAQELSTDEAVVAWNDPGIQDFHNMNWSSSNPMLTGLYARCFYVITLSNEFIRESDPAKVSGRGISGTDASDIAAMRLEARYVRSYVYWVLMDLFARPGFTDENTPIGASVLPPQIERTDLFKKVETELLALENEAALPATSAGARYGRASKAAVQALLARMYLNAGVYTGTASYDKALTYAQKVIGAGYSLMPNYTQIMLADNNTANPEAIWTINFDGVKTQSYGGTTFLVNASVGGDMDRAVSGLTGWGGLRCTKNLPNLFPDYTGTIDKRAQFFQQKLEIDNIAEFKDGYAVIKYRNKTRTGGFGTDPSRTFADIDFPVFRLAEMYLIYAEAAWRTSTNKSQGATYFNALRQRAYGNANGNLSEGLITLDIILDERARELYWEGHRRTDLIRYNKFSDGTYLWPWKGGVKTGTGVDSYRRIYPIPSTETSSNPNIKQNTGY